MSRTVKVIFPHNEVREIVPDSWQAIPVCEAISDTLKPIFNIPGYLVQETVDGKYYAIPTGEH